jgi:hypothetical protein
MRTLREKLGIWALAARWLALMGLVGAAGCRRDAALGLPDSYLVLTPVVDAQGEGRRSGSGLPLFEVVALDDARAVALHKEIAVGIVGEMLRSDYLAKQLVRDVAIAGNAFPEAARAAAREPTIFVIGRNLAPFGIGFATKSFFGGAADHPDLPWIGLKEDVGEDRAMRQTVTGLLARRAVTRVVGTSSPSVLLEGYGRAMEVIAREWRVGEGPQGAVAPDAGTGTQRALFAGVRENQFAVGPDGAPRPAAELVADPGLAATVIYRLAQSKAVGRRVAPADVYAPFVTDRVPNGVSPAAVLGPFRNFQAKLLTAWGRAVLGGAPPADVTELVDAYGRAMPDERAEAFRVLVVTTYGATVKAGGVRASDPAAALPELTALAAEVAAGRVSSRAALAPR